MNSKTAPIKPYIFTVVDGSAAKTTTTVAVTVHVDTEPPHLKVRSPAAAQA
jgi:hypothetical protein